MDLTRITALVDAIIGGVTSIFSSVYNRVTGQAPEVEEAEEVPDEAKLKKRKIVSIIAGLVIFGSLSSIFFTECERAPRINLQPMITLGNSMARETARMIDDKGGVVLIVMDYGTRAVGNEAQIKAFIKTLGQHKEITLLATEKIQLKQDGPPDLNGFPSSVYFSILEKYPKVAGIVSFIGPPSLTDEELEKLPPVETRPKVAVTTFFPVPMKKHFENHVIHLAITQRMMNRPPTTGAPKTAQEQFEQQYEIITPDNAADLPF